MEGIRNPILRVNWYQALASAFLYNTTLSKWNVFEDYDDTVLQMKAPQLNSKLLDVLLGINRSLESNKKKNGYTETPTVENTEYQYPLATVPERLVEQSFGKCGIISLNF